MKLLHLGLWLGAFSIMAVAGWSQPWPGPGPGPHPMEPIWSANVENLRLIKMLEVLDLTEEQSEKFVPLVHSFRRDLRQLREERRVIADSLVLLLEQKGKEADLTRLFAALRDNRKKADERADRYIVDCGAILTIYQQGRLLLFEEHFERDVLKSLREFRGGKMPGMPPNPDEG